MDKKTMGIIATVAAVVLCGCPGLISLCMGLTFAFVSQVPEAEIDMFGSNDPQAALMTGIGMLCVGMIAVIVPFVVGFIALRRRPDPLGSYTGTLPPTS